MNRDTGHRAPWTGQGPFLLGVTGGIASGKTTVAQILAELGALTIDFDLLARTIVEPGQPAYLDIVGHFGRAIIQPDKTLDRKKLSALVFQDEIQRRRLESFTHPRIAGEYARELQRLSAVAPRPIIQLVVPLLIEARMEGLCHRVLVVYVPRAVQIARLVARDGIGPDEAERILAAQMPIDDKLKRADLVVDNRGNPEETRRMVTAAWAELEEFVTGNVRPVC